MNGEDVLARNQILSAAVRKRSRERKDRFLERRKARRAGSEFPVRNVMPQNFDSVDPGDKPIVRARHQLEIPFMVGIGDVESLAHEDGAVSPIHVEQLSAGQRLTVKERSWPEKPRRIVEGYSTPIEGWR